MSELSSVKFFPSFFACAFKPLSQLRRLGGIPQDFSQLTTILGPSVDRVEELRQGTDTQPLWLRSVRQAEELPSEGLPQMSDRSHSEVSRVSQGALALLSRWGRWCVDFREEAGAAQFC